MNAADMIRGEQKVLVKLIQGASFLTGDNTKFTKEHPYQLLPPAMAFWLVENESEKFVIATKEDLQSHYK